MLVLEIPGFGPAKLEHLVSDYTGTLSFGGRFIPGVRERLGEIARTLKVHILTADTFGTAKVELNGVACELHILEGSDHDVQKEEYVKKLGASGVIALGNGNNDRLMLKAVRVGIAVLEGEGCSVDAIVNADILVRNISEGLDLLLNPNRLKATLRY